MARVGGIARTNGVCGRCADLIENKKQTGKYRPMKQPAKCAGCGQKSVFQAYCTYCSACANTRRVCMRCGDVRQEARPRSDHDTEVAQLQAKLDQGGLREREVRSTLRKLEAAQQAARAHAKARREAVAQVQALSQSEIAADYVETMTTTTTTTMTTTTTAAAATAVMASGRVTRPRRRPKQPSASSQVRP